MATSLRMAAYAKVNLLLDVLGKRADGYHEVRLVLQPLALADTVTVTLSDRLALTCSNPKLPVGEDNLALRAARVLQGATGRTAGARIHIDKRIPVAAGLGGGSADAAAVLCGLNELWETDLARPELLALAAQLGSDVPYCVLNQTCLGQGRGEALTPLPPAPVIPMVVAWPRVTWTGPKTATVYQAFRLEQVERHPDLAAMEAALRDQDSGRIAAAMLNVLEAPVTALHPIVGRLRAAMLAAGALGACMTGAGPAVFGLARSRADAERMASAVRPLAPTVLVTETLAVAPGTGAAP